jgi:magnesium chelatase family protein
MSFSRVTSAQLDGLEPNIVTVEVDISDGLFSFSLVGLPDKAVEESKDRVSSAIKNAGFKSHKQKNQKVVISLAPAELKKTGPAFDLAIAVGYLLSAGEISFDPKGKLFLGELSLDGDVRSIHGALPIARYARELGFKEVFVPPENAKEAALIEGISIFSPQTLRDLISHLDPQGAYKRMTRPQRNSAQENSFAHAKSLSAHPKTHFKKKESERTLTTLSEIRGQTSAKRALTIAAAGGHNILLFGPPGTGKTLLAKAFVELLPDLSFEDALEVTSVHSAAGTLRGALVERPPFRSPHHTSSYAAIIGGGAYPRPGEITLAHRGVLFLDEFPEFDRRVIESLREPLEERKLTVSRSQRSALFPADVILVAAMNPCPCGNRGSSKECVCSPKDLVRYERKLSGPVIDRIDLWVEVGEIALSKLRKLPESEKREREREVEDMKRGIQRAVGAQEKRFEGLKATRNAHMSPENIHTKLRANDSVYELLEGAAHTLGLSARGYHKMLKIARTVADIEGAEEVKKEHLLEALQYRQKPLFL